MKKLFLLVSLSISLLNSQAQQATTTGLTDLKTFKERVDSCDVNLRTHRSPLIGLSVSHQEGNSIVSGTYIQSIIKAGGTPVLIPVTADGAVLRNIVASLDGLVLSGGADINPLWYNEQPHQQLQTVDPARDEYELKLLKMATDRNIPVLGICRGLQLINVLFGGTLYQDLPSQRKGAIKHVQSMPDRYGSHLVSITDGSQLAAILHKDTVVVNSFHHQAVKNPAAGFRAVAYAADSTIEAIEAWPNRPILGVQWHPEKFVAAGDTTMLPLFRFLVEKADTFHLAKEMHARILSVDSHTDTPFWFDRPGFSLADRERNRVNFPKMEEGRLDGVYLAAYIGQGKRDDVSLQEAVQKVDGLITGIHRQIELNKDICGLAVTPDDFIRLKKEGKFAVFIGIENGYGIGKDISNIARFRQRGITYITLCHSYDNDICDTSTHTKKEWKGLSPFGREVVQEMNRQGIMIDLSHAGESTFWDVIKLTTAPVICSHSSSRALCDHDRNLTDDQLRALAQNGGVAQLCLLNAYINTDRRNACLMDAVEHLDHMIKIAGIDHVGIGSDFDGGGGIIGCEADNDLLQLTVKLIERGYSEEDIAKIWSGNLMRVLKQVQDAAAVKSL